MPWSRRLSRWNSEAFWHTGRVPDILDSRSEGLWSPGHKKHLNIAFQSWTTWHKNLSNSVSHVWTEGTFLIVLFRVGQHNTQNGFISHLHSRTHKPVQHVYIWTKVSQPGSVVLYYYVYLKIKTQIGLKVFYYFIHWCCSQGGRINMYVQMWFDFILYTVFHLSFSGISPVLGL